MPFIMKNNNINVVFVMATSMLAALADALQNGSPLSNFRVPT